MSKEYGDLSLRSKIELSEQDQLFLIDRLKEKEYKKILEIGTFMGGVTNILHHVLPESNIYSVDLSPSDIVGSTFSGDYSKVRFFNGKYSFEVIEEIGEDIDLVFIDTDHVLPGELLDYLMVYPFLKKNHSVIIHDIDLHRIKPDVEGYSISPRLLFNTLFGIKLSQWNIGYVELEDVDMSDEILSCLTFPWNNLNVISKRKALAAFFEQYYSLYFSREFEAICDEQLSRQIKNLSS